MKKIKLPVILAIVALVTLIMLGCPNEPGGNNTPSFKAVTDITGVPTLKQTETALMLVGTVEPTDATNKTIVWSIADDDDDSASPSLDGNVLTTETEGTVKLLATIANGLTASKPFTKPFTITVTDDEVSGCGCCVDCGDDCEGDCCENCTCGVHLIAIDIAVISGVIAPATQETPVTADITETEQFTGTVSWNGNPSVFASHTVYTATITLTAKYGFTFDDVDENFFEVLGAETTTNAANSNIVTAVFPATGGTQAEELVAKWHSTQSAANVNTATPLFEFIEDGKILKKNGSDDGFTYSVDGNTITITRSLNDDTANFYVYGTTLTITNATGTHLVNGIYFKYSNEGTSIGGGDSDFTSGTKVTTFNIHNETQWNAARMAISTGGDDRNYIVNIIETVEVGGTNSPSYKNSLGDFVYETFRGPAKDITVSLRGTGTLALSKEPLHNGALLTVGPYQTVILHGLTLQGDFGNDDALVVIDGDNSAFILHSGKITGNKNGSNDERYKNGGGVRLTNATDAAFIMNGGEISDNSASGKGGGVYSAGTFTMNGGTITDNYAGADGGGVAAYALYNDFIMMDGEISNNSAGGNGGGVAVENPGLGSFTMHGGEILGNSASLGSGGGVYGDMRISTGKIYGTDALPAERNMAGNGDALQGTATVGTYNGTTFTPNTSGTLTIPATDDTIWVVNGVLKYSDVGDAPMYLLENLWYTTQDNANKREGDFIEFVDHGRIHVNGAYTGLVFTVSGNTLTVTNGSLQITNTRTFSYSETGTGNDKQFKLSLTGSGDLLAQEYFIPNPDYVPSFDITNAQQWAAAITYANGKKGKIDINILNDVSVAGATAIAAAAGETLEITIKGIGAVRTVSLNSNGRLLSIGARVTVVLEENLTLQGRAANNNALVFVGGTMIMNNGTRITGNTNVATEALGGGVYVQGTFIMNGGIISGNTATSANISDGSFTSRGGGVYVSNGTFIMNGGEISSNTVTSNAAAIVRVPILEGGGVYVYYLGTFTMNGGEILNNSARYSDISSVPYAYGGGVYIYSGATFTMNNGKISGNTANAASTNSSAALSSQSFGGGVYVEGTFNMNNGEISGNSATATHPNSRRAEGGGVYVDYGTLRMSNGTINGNTGTLPNTATTSGASLCNNNGTATYGPAPSGSGGGTLTTRNTTINVVNGVLQ